jgi:Winged helix-turn-helix DNA-binding
VADSESWTFLTNHGHILLLLAKNPDLRLRDLAEQVGITERSAQKIVTELETAGYLTKTKVGRRNAYKVHPDLHFRHPLEADHRVGELFNLFTTPPPMTSKVTAGRSAPGRPVPRRSPRAMKATGDRHR